MNGRKEILPSCCRPRALKLWFSGSWPDCSLLQHHRVCKLIEKAEGTRNKGASDYLSSVFPVQDSNLKLMDVWRKEPCTVIVVFQNTKNLISHHSNGLEIFEAQLYICIQCKYQGIKWNIKWVDHVAFQLLHGVLYQTTATGNANPFCYLKLSFFLYSDQTVTFLWGKQAEKKPFHWTKAISKGLQEGLCLVTGLLVKSLPNYKSCCSIMVSNGQTSEVKRVQKLVCSMARCVYFKLSSVKR